jgi:hypothetical protein
MKRTQFTVQETDKKKREKFYDYIKKKYELNNWYPYTREKFIESDFPFVVDFKERMFWVCESVTCCAAAASAGVIFTIKDFKKIEKERSDLK